MKRIGAIIVFATILGAIALYFSGVATRAGEREHIGDKESARPQVVRCIGYVEPSSEIRRLVFKVDGVISSIRVEIGQRVCAGDILVSLQNGDEQAALEAAKEMFELAIAERDQLCAGIHPDKIQAAKTRVENRAEQLAYVEKQHQRIANLAAKNATSTEESDRAEADLIQAKKALLEAESELASMENHVRTVDKFVADKKVAVAQAGVAVAQRCLDNTIMTAPTNGTVLEILRREGEGARLLDRDPILIFADDSLLRVRAEVDERYVNEIKPGQRAEVYGRGLGSRRFSGTVALVKRVMGNKTVFSREASERKDLDVLQILIDMPPEFVAPLGLKVDVDIATTAQQSDGGLVLSPTGSAG